MARSTELKEVNEIEEMHTVGDNAHVTDVGGPVHQGPDLVCGVQE